MPQQVLTKLVAVFFIAAASSLCCADNLKENGGCAVPGISARWQAAYCMAKNETDDYENDGVTECIIQEEKAQPKFQTGCDENAYWKKKLCILVTKGKQELEDCFTDKKLIPSIVKNGVGN
jgi:hypothetical protein